MPTPDPSLLRHVAANLRAARLARGWSQQTLAEEAGVSRRMVVAIEAEESNVSLATLDRLAAALGVTFAALVQPPEPDGGGPVLVWKGGNPVSRARLMLSVPAQGVVELWEWSLGRNERYEAEPDRPGMQELIYVVSGALTVEVGGRRERVAEGAAIAFASDQPYAYLNEGEERVRFVKNVVG